MSVELQFMNKENFELLNNMNNQIIKMLSSLIKAVSK
ncbi:MAG: hypothetical protein FWF54_11105 [Candidatus Azobacteroides sp.]|nr:hypothetical protein [Candidatus Azobacteroides sp.]